MIVGEELVAQCMGPPLATVVAAESCSPLLAERSRGEERAYPGSQGGIVNDEDIALLQITLGR